MIKVYLKEILKERNMTLKELSNMTGISSNTLSSIQNEKKESIHFPTLDKITKALDIQVGDLIKRVNIIYNLSIKDIQNIDENKYNIFFYLRDINNENISMELMIPIKLTNNKIIEIEIFYEDLISFKNNITDDALRISIDDNIENMFEVINFLIVQEFILNKTFSNSPFTVVISYLTTNDNSLDVSILKKIQKTTINNTSVISWFTSTLVPFSNNTNNILPDKNSLSSNELVTDIYIVDNKEFIININ